MEKYRTRESEQGSFVDFERDRDELEAAKRRLSRLIRLNSEFTPPGSTNLRNSFEDLPAATAYEKAYPLLGLWMGILPPSAFFLRIAVDRPGGDLGVLFLVTALVCSTAAATGYFTGKIVGKIVRELADFPWPARLAALPFVGITWGILAGGAGGAMIMLLGAIPGAFIGALAGFAALPVFAILHSALLKYEGFERKHVYPAAIGVAATIAALILGFPA